MIFVNSFVNLFDAAEVLRLSEQLRLKTQEYSTTLNRQQGFSASCDTVQFSKREFADLEQNVKRFTEKHAQEVRQLQSEIASLREDRQNNSSLIGNESSC